MHMAAHIVAINAVLNFRELENNKILYPAWTNCDLLNLARTLINKKVEIQHSLSHQLPHSFS